MQSRIRQPQNKTRVRARVCSRVYDMICTCAFAYNNIYYIYIHIVGHSSSRISPTMPCNNFQFLRAPPRTYAVFSCVCRSYRTRACACIVCAYIDFYLYIGIYAVTRYTRRSAVLIASLSPPRYTYEKPCVHSPRTCHYNIKSASIIIPVLLRLLLQLPPSRVDDAAAAGALDTI